MGNDAEREKKLNKKKNLETKYPSQSFQKFVQTRFA
jgi:hypothetical protein